MPAQGPRWYATSFSLSLSRSRSRSPPPVSRSLASTLEPLPVPPDQECSFQAHLAVRIAPRTNTHVPAHAHAHSQVAVAPQRAWASIVFLPHKEVCPDGAVIEAQKGESVIDAALRNGLVIEHACEKSCACTT